MDYSQLEELGEKLRSIGHRRRELVEKTYQEVKEGDEHSSRDLYRELSQISDEAIRIIQKQKELFDQEISRL